MVRTRERVVSRNIVQVQSPIVSASFQIKINMVVAFITASAATYGWWYFVSRQRRINYENFHKNYDFDKEYERMKKAGVFTGIPADE